MIISATLDAASTVMAITVAHLQARADKEIGPVCRVLADAVTGTQIPNLIAPLKVTEQPGEQQNTKWKRLFNAA